MTRGTEKNQQIRLEHSEGRLCEGKKNCDEWADIGKQDCSYECCVSVSLSILEQSANP